MLSPGKIQKPIVQVGNICGFSTIPGKYPQVGLSELFVAMI